MDDLLEQQRNLLGVGEELLRSASRQLKDAAGPDALRSAYELYRGFYEAVNWGEPWLVAVLSFHVVMLGVTWVTRKSELKQGLIFLLCAFLVRIAETLNTLASDHWQSFSTQNYFDKDGVFTTSVFCAPLMGVLVLVLINVLRLMASVMIDVKRAQLKQQARIRGGKKDK
ncbi:hypothetical protein OAD67_00085 [bacterium]|jgi:hypothetical protein|nr:hypothetical protein [bacterium]MDB9924635.1 hypothetical protein [bacterium]|tara:strand:- start:436 stop:945 length:510 start_codon:yes stop_codon:yes gene_type:complete